MFNDEKLKELYNIQLQYTKLPTQKNKIITEIKKIRQKRNELLKSFSF